LVSISTEASEELIDMLEFFIAKNVGDYREIFVFSIVVGYEWLWL